MNGQISLFDIFPIDYCQKSRKQNDIDILVRKGSGFVKGKLRILAFYNLNNPTITEFANFLKHEYGDGGCSVSDYWEHHNGSGISIDFRGRAKYKFTWTEFAKLVAESINNDEYVTDKDIPKDEYYVAKHMHGSYTHLRKSYQITYGYDGKKLITAHLSSCTKDNVCGMVESFSNKYSHVDISIHELVNGIECGTYETETEIWEDIKRSGRRVSPSIFGGKKFLDERGIADFLSNYKKHGYVFKSRDYVDEEYHNGTFYSLRLRVKRGELSKEFLSEKM